MRMILKNRLFKFSSLLIILCNCHKDNLYKNDSKKYKLQGVFESGKKNQKKSKNNNDFSAKRKKKSIKKYLKNRRKDIKLFYSGSELQKSTIKEISKNLALDIKYSYNLVKEQKNTIDRIKNKLSTKILNEYTYLNKNAFQNISNLKETTITKLKYLLCFNEEKYINDTLDPDNYKKLDTNTLFTNYINAVKTDIKKFEESLEKKDIENKNNEAFNSYKNEKNVIIKAVMYADYCNQTQNFANKSKNIYSSINFNLNSLYNLKNINSYYAYETLQKMNNNIQDLEKIEIDFNSIKRVIKNYKALMEQYDQIIKNNQERIKKDQANED